MSAPIIDYSRLREHAALSNSPILYWLTYETEHRIGIMWAYQWLINFVRGSEFVAFHPYALRLIRENLLKWKGPFSEKNDYELFIQGAFDNPTEAEQLITQAITQDRVLYKQFGTWMLY